MGTVDTRDVASMTASPSAGICRRTVLKGAGALLASVAALSCPAWASEGVERVEDLGQDAGGDSSDEGSSVVALNEVVYPEPISSDDYDLILQVEQDNPLDDELLEGLAAFADNLTCYGIGVADGIEPNACLSPVSLYVALALLAQGAQGDGRMQLLDALGFQDASRLAEQCAHLIRVLWARTTPEDDLASSVLQVTNSVWMRSDAPFEQGFIDVATDELYAECFEVARVDEDAAAQMGRWIADHTGSTLSPEVSLDGSWVASLVSTVWFKDGWLVPFSEEDTAVGTFHAQDEDVECDFMTLTRACSLVRSSGYQLASLALSTGAKMVFLLPDEGIDPRSYLLRATGIGKLFAATDAESDYAYVTFKVPRVSFDTTSQLVDVCKKLGVVDVFAPDADLGLMTCEPVSVNSVEQGTHFSMNEQGVEASAYTMVAVTTSLELCDEEAEFFLDRPFAFQLIDSHGIVLFTGVVGDPSQG